MYREPYYHHYLKIKDRPFEEFLKFSIEDYEKCNCMWNQKNESYLRMSNEVRTASIFAVEDFQTRSGNIHSSINQLICQTFTDLP